MRYALFIALFCALLPLPSWAQSSAPSSAELVEKTRQLMAQEAYEKKLRSQPLTHKDSIDYTIDDGKMSTEEMEEEAEYIYALCAQNSYQSLYFDCKCLSGAFLLERERLGPTALQSGIMENLTQSNNAKCANIEGFAGESYKSCMSYAKSYREFEKDNDELCTCAANRAANNFKQKPWLDSSYIRSTNTGALMYCLDVNNRAKDNANKQSLKTQN